jgi:SAM-dependent methyltransferase
VRFGQLPAVADALEIGAGGRVRGREPAGPVPRLAADRHRLDEDMVELARARLGRFSHRARVERADAVSLRYVDRSFDLVISILVWHHVEGWQKALAEAARILRPRGWLLTVDLLHPFPSGPLRRLRLHGTYGFDQFRAALAAGGFVRWRVDRGPAWCLALAETASGDERATASSRFKP